MSPPVYSTTLFPDVIGQAYERFRSMRTLAASPDTASDQTLSLDVLYPLWQYRVEWTVLQLSDAQNLLHAYEFMGGATLGLFFFEWPPNTFQNAYVGLGDGTSNPITLPVKGASAGTTAVRANGSAIPGTFSASTGANGEDRFLPSSSVANGSTIRADFTGRRRRAVRFLTDDSFELSIRPNTAPLLWQARAELIESVASDV